MSGEQYLDPKIDYSNVVGVTPATMPGLAGEGTERTRNIDPRYDPEQRYATRRWRTELTTDTDWRKGR